MVDLAQQMNDFVGPELDTIADRMKRGISQFDMDKSFAMVVHLLGEKIYATPKSKYKLVQYKGLNVGQGVLHSWKVVLKE